MKILHVIPSFAPAWRYGGPIHSAVGLTRELVRQGHEVTVMTTNIDGPGVLDVPVAHPVPMEGVEVWYFPVERPRWWCYSRPLGKALRQVKRFDLVHIHSIFLWPTRAAALSSHRQGVPYIVRPAGSLDPLMLSKAYASWRVSLPSRLKKWTYLATLGRRELGRASAIHFTSRAEMEAATPLRLRPPGFVAPLGIDLRPLQEETDAPSVGEQYQVLQGKKIILFLSRLDPVKGLDLLIPAVAHLARQRQDCALVIAGQGTPAYEAKLRALARHHGLQDRAVFVGRVEGQAKWQWLRGADIFVLPSFHENFGVAVVEAMAAGTPVVISDKVNIHQEISKAQAGLVTDLDPVNISTALNTLLEDANLRKDMGRKGADLVRERYTWEKVVSDLSRTYGSVMDGRLASPGGQSMEIRGCADS